MPGAVGRDQCDTGSCGSPAIRVASGLNSAVARTGSMVRRRCWGGAGPQRSGAVGGFTPPSFLRVASRSRRQRVLPDRRVKAGVNPYGILMSRRATQSGWSHYSYSRLVLWVLAVPRCAPSATPQALAHGSSSSIPADLGPQFVIGADQPGLLPVPPHRHHHMPRHHIADGKSHRCRCCQRCVGGQNIARGTGSPIATPGDGHAGDHVAGGPQHPV